MKKTFVISVGGSLLVPDEIDAEYIKSFVWIISSMAKKGGRFIINPGGGRTCRKYQEALKNIIRANNEDLDWIGIATNRFHSRLLQLVFKNLAAPIIPNTPNDRVVSGKPVIIGPGGWKPGRSSDDSAVRLAAAYGAKTVINLSNIDYVYTKDPRKFKDAEKIENISWRDFLKIIGTKWDPGANVPFDPTAAKFSETHGIKVIIANGRNLDNLKNILTGKDFIGTTIS